MFSPQWREDDAEIVEDEQVVQLACWAIGVYDKPYWHSDQIPDDVWELVDVDLAETVTEHIESGASWNEAVETAWRQAVNGAEERHHHVVRMMNEVSFTVEFEFGTDTARITDPVGWIAGEVAVAEGTREQIRNEAHRLVDLAVTTERCSKYANRGAGGELKRNITLAMRLARMAPQRAARG